MNTPYCGILIFLLPALNVKHPHYPYAHHLVYISFYLLATSYIIILTTPWTSTSHLPHSHSLLSQNRRKVRTGERLGCEKGYLRGYMLFVLDDISPHITTHIPQNHNPSIKHDPSQQLQWRIKRVCLNETSSRRREHECSWNSGH